MLNRDSASPPDRVTAIVQRLLAQRSLDSSVGLRDDLRQVGLSSLDMISLMLSVEAEFELTVPEEKIDPANFRSIELISALVADLLANR